MLYSVCLLLKRKSSFLTVLVIIPNYNHTIVLTKLIAGIWQFGDIAKKKSDVVRNMRSHMTRRVWNESSG